MFFIPAVPAFISERDENEFGLTKVRVGGNFENFNSTHLNSNSTNVNLKKRRENISGETL